MSWRDNVYYRYFVQQPLITRTYLAGIVAVSLPSLLTLLHPIYLLNLWDYTLRGEFWRPLTAFLYGGAGLPLLFGIFFAYQYSIQLETGKFGDSTADYAYYILCSWINLMVSGNFWSTALEIFRPHCRESIRSFLAGACIIATSSPGESAEEHFLISILRGSCDSHVSNSTDQTIIQTT